MIISHKYRFIFIHSRKTAGSSITMTLARHLGPFDIQVGVHGDSLKMGIWPNLNAIIGLLNPSSSLVFVKNLLKGKNVADSFNAANKSRYMHICEQPAHAGAREIRKSYPMEWESYTKICVVRNPYDRIISDYHWSTRNLSFDDKPTFEEFCKLLKEGKREGLSFIPKRYDNWLLYTIDNKVAVDIVIRYENLIPELNSTMIKLDIPWDGWLPNAKATKNKSKNKISHSQLTKIIVANLFQNEISEFGFEEDS